MSPKAAEPQPETRGRTEPGLNPPELAWEAMTGPVMTLQGVFTEAVPHERIVHTETMVTGSGEAIGSLLETHEFEETNGVTTMRIT